MAFTMDRWLLTFFLGAILSLFLPIVPDFSLVFFFIFLTIVFWLLANKIKLFALCTSFSLAAAWIVFQGTHYNNALVNNNISADAIFHQIQVIQGEVSSLINHQNASVNFNFIVNSVNNKPLLKPFKVRLSWQQPPQPINQQQYWQLNVKLKPAHGLANTGGFSYQTWLREHQLVASGYVKSKDSQLLENTISLRQHWFNQLESRLINKPRSALFLALTFGDRQQLTQADWQVLQLTGTQHLIAISGLHIGLVAMGSFYFFLLLLKLVNGCLLFLLAQWSDKYKHDYQIFCSQQNLYLLAIVFSVSCAFFYSYLAGFSAPTTRALIMLCLFWLMKLLAVKISKTRLVLLSLFFILLIQPMSIIGAGFWLSFYAVSIIFLLLWLYQQLISSEKKWLRYLQSLVLIQFGLSLFILPVAALLQNQIPLAAVLANLLAVPLMSLICLPLCVLAMLSGLIIDESNNFFVDIALASLHCLWQWLELFQQVNWSLLTVSFYFLMLILIIMVMALCGLNKANNRLRFVSLTLLPLIFYFVIDTNEHNKHHQHIWQLHVFDVGQGLAVLIQKNNHAMLYDTGASYPSGFIMAESVISPYLKNQGINQLDNVIISHSDNDHAGGLLWLKENITIKQIIANDVSLNADNVCDQYNDFIWQGLTINIIWPLEKNEGKSNDDSCVLQISDGTHSVLLTGDISTKVEGLLVADKSTTQNQENSLRSTVLVAPHHGSNTSSSTEFLNVVQPKWAVFSAGFMNRWHMPTTKVIDRYQKLNINTLKTSESGMISFTFNEDLIDVSEYKKHQYPFWFAN